MLKLDTVLVVLSGLFLQLICLKYTYQHILFSIKI